MAQFIKVGKRVINLDNVTDINLDGIGTDWDGDGNIKACVSVLFPMSETNPNSETAQDAHYLNFFGEEAAALRRYLNKASTDVMEVYKDAERTEAIKERATVLQGEIGDLADVDYYLYQVIEMIETCMGHGMDLYEVKASDILALNK